MLTRRRRIREPGRTEFTCVRSFARVQSHVQSEADSGEETFLAFVAGETGIGMRTTMSTERLAALEGSVALVTSMGTSGQVADHVPF